MPPFKLDSAFAPAGDQPKAIADLVRGLEHGDRFQTLLGVTGSGKTMTVANVIQAVGRPTLVLSHNKTLAAQLYEEFKSFFPRNAVEYFISYYDYYQPEAYVPTTDTYIEKDASINEDIDRLRLRRHREVSARRCDHRTRPSRRSTGSAIRWLPRDHGDAGARPANPAG